MSQLGTPSNDLIQSLMNDPVKRMLVLQLLDAEKEGFRKYRRDELKSAKKQTAQQYQSPSAIMRKRELAKLQKRYSDTSSSEQSAETPSKAVPDKGILQTPKKPFSELLKGVTAFVEVKRNDEDKSDGIKMIMLSMGATIKDQLKSGVTHVVFKDGSFTTFQKAKLLKAHLVSVLWIDAIKRNQCRVPEKNYPAIGGDYNEENMSALCSQLQKDFEDIVQDERRRSFTSSSRARSKEDKDRRKTMYFNPAAQLNDSSSVDSELSKKSDASVSVSKNSSIDHMPNCFVQLSPPDLTSDESDCGVVNGHSSSHLKDKYRQLQSTENTTISSSASKSLITCGGKFIRRPTINDVSDMNITPNVSVNDSKSTNISDDKSQRKRLAELQASTMTPMTQLRKSSRLTDVSKTNKENARSCAKMFSENDTSGVTAMSSLRLSSRSASLSSVGKRNSKETQKSSGVITSFTPLRRPPKSNSNSVVTSMSSLRLSDSGKEAVSPKSSINSRQSPIKNPSVILTKIPGSEKQTQNAILSAKRKSEENLNKRSAKKRRESISSGSESDVPAKSKSSRKNILDSNDESLEIRSGKLQNVKSQVSKTKQNNSPPKIRTTAKSKRRLFNVDDVELGRALPGLEDGLNDLNLKKTTKQRKCIAFIDDSDDESKSDGSDDFPKKTASAEKRKSPEMTKSQKKAKKRLYNPDDVGLVNVSASQDEKEREAKNIEILARSGKKVNKEATTAVPQQVTKGGVSKGKNASTSSSFNKKKNDDLRKASKSSTASNNKDSINKEKVDHDLRCLIGALANGLLDKKKKKDRKLSPEKKMSDVLAHKYLPQLNKDKSDQAKEKNKKNSQQSDSDSDDLNSSQSSTDSETPRKSRSSILPITPIVRRSTHEFQIQSKGKSLKKINAEELKKPGIVCTMFHREESLNFDKTVKQLGRFQSENQVTDRTTHLVVGETRRTVNLLKALARGCWILKHEWLLDSQKKGHWVDERPYELTEFSPAVQQMRRHKEAFGPTFLMDIFENCGTFYIANNTKPPHSDLKELITICGGKLTTISRNATIVIGQWIRHEKIKCVSETWVLDSIEFNRLKSFKKYLLKPPNEHFSQSRASPTF